MALPQTTTDNDGFSYNVAGKAIVWTWLERIHPKKARVPNPDVIGVRVADESDKELLIVRDAFACKPAVVAETDDYVAIASEFRSLAHLPGVRHANVFEPRPSEIYSWKA